MRENSNRTEPRIPQYLRELGPFRNFRGAQVRADAGRGIATAGKAFVNWLRAALLDALLVGILWFIGLELLHIPLAPLWGVVGGLAQFIPGIGGMLALIGPALSLLFTRPNWEEYGLLLGLYAVIVVIDQLAIQPLLLRKITRVPIWASIFVPILLGILIPFWGVLLAAPLLAMVFAFRKPKPPRVLGKDTRAKL